VLSEPQRFAGAAILYGTLPFDAGVPLTRARLAGVPVFVAQGESDDVIPRDLLDRTGRYLLANCGAPTYARRDPGVHQLTSSTVAELAGWVAERLNFLTLRSPLDPGRTAWPTLPGGDLPPRAGDRPELSWAVAHPLAGIRLAKGMVMIRAPRHRRARTRHRPRAGEPRLRHRNARRCCEQGGCPVTPASGLRPPPRRPTAAPHRAAVHRRPPEPR
jgi:hypothetical protein